MSTHANPRQPMPIHVPIAGQFFTKKESLSIVQSEPILANPMPIHANPTPISCHLREPFPHLTKEQVLYVGWPLVHSEDDFKTIEHSQFLPIHSSAGQSMPILDNQVPIPGQSVTSYVLNHRTSRLYGMVLSLLEGQI